jgi:hypothetical protein
MTLLSHQLLQLRFQLTNSDVFGDQAGLELFVFFSESMVCILVLEQLARISLIYYLYLFFRLRQLGLVGWLVNDFGNKLFGRRRRSRSCGGILQRHSLGFLGLSCKEFVAGQSRLWRQAIRVQISLEAFHLLTLAVIIS